MSTKPRVVVTAEREPLVIETWGGRDVGVSVGVEVTVTFDYGEHDAALIELAATYEEAVEKLEALRGP